jgi:tetratricopeptide (TPR) repeat protein
MRYLFLTFASLFLCAGLVRAAETESLPERTLRGIVERQKQLFAEAEKQGDKMDEEAFRSQAQSIVHDYDRLLAGSDKFAAGYAAYGYFLRKVDMRKEAAAMLFKADSLDPKIPLVKNEIGSLLAEDGKPIEAAVYFLAAIKLAPNEPLYHYQLGTLLTEARDTFLKSGEWTRPGLEHSMQEAFRRAAELAPDRFEFAYRYAESFYDLENPDWDAALKAWTGLEEKAQSEIERQTMRLHKANIYIKTGKIEQAKALLATVNDPKLQVQKDRLTPLLKPAEAAKK